jgi:RHS repeat-associated protein
VTYQRTRYNGAPSKPSSWSSYTADGLLFARSGAFPANCPPGTVYLDTLYQTADAAGNVIISGAYVDDGCTSQSSQTASNMYYASDNRLMFVQKKTDDATSTWEEYWYDALGRRVMTRTRHDMPTCVQSPSMSCPGFVERTVWDGDQVIGEQRTSGLDLITGGTPYYGTVRYVHLVGMDAPVAILDARFSDARVIHYNWRGLAEASSFTDGSPADCELTGGTCTRIAWNAGEGVYFKRSTDPYAGMIPVWIGSLPANGKGDAGLLYRRNRFFDPASGRFTQEDPIGIGGGLNLYGFAGGDPVNYSDPFGLCPPKDDKPCNQDTGDKNLDDPVIRQNLEDKYYGAPDAPGHAGYQVEVAGYCTARSCTSKVGQIDQTNGSGARPRGARLQYHTHPNVGLPDVNKPGNVYLDPPSDFDRANARDASRRGLSSYLLTPSSIYRMTPDGQGGTTVVCFQRWNNSSAGCPQ